MFHEAERPGLRHGHTICLFCGNDTGSRTAAILFSLISSANRHHLDPFAWLKGLLTQLPLLRAENDPDELLQRCCPDVWAASA